MKKISLVIIMILIVNAGLFSQSVYVNNALKFSTYDYGGTARFVGMGGAFGALGGDFSSIAINPAGLGVFRSSEMVFSPGMTYNSNTSNYINNTVNDYGFNMNINNMGFVVSNSLENSDTRWVNFNVGVGHNRVSDLNQNIHFRGVNNSSLMEVFVYEANNPIKYPHELDGMYEYLLYDALILGFDSTNVLFFNEIDDEAWTNPDFEISQQKIIQTEGGINEYSFSFGGNYANKLYVGASIGITQLNYTEYASHYEVETSGAPIPYMSAFDFEEYSTTKGTGFTFKLGAIYRPIDFLRIGASVHMPTFYNLKQKYYNAATGYFDDYNPEYSESQELSYRYGLNTPFRFIGSFGFQIAKFALIDIDYEYVDYTTMKMSDEYRSQGVIEDNMDIKTIFQETHNFRFGAEFRTGSLYYRLGGRYSTSPYADVQGALNPSFEKITYTGGLGYRIKHFFVDFAYSHAVSTYNLRAYNWEWNYEVASIDSRLNSFVLTFGIKF